LLRGCIAAMRRKELKDYFSLQAHNYHKTKKKSTCSSSYSDFVSALILLCYFYDIQKIKKYTFFQKLCK
jgi:hypothetical protein